LRPVPPLSDVDARLHILDALALVPGDAEPAYDALVRLAAQGSGCPVAMLNLVGPDTQWTQAAFGMEAMTVPRSLSVCAHAVDQRQALLVPDLLADPRFARHPLLTGPSPLRFYAAEPVWVSGAVVGTVCVLDHRIRELSPAAAQALRDAAALCAALLESRLHEHRVRDASHAGSGWLWESDASGRLTWLSDDVTERLGIDAAHQVGRVVTEVNRPRDDDTRGSWDAYVAARARHEPFADAVADRASAEGTITVSFSGQPRFAANGRFLGYRGASRIVTAEIAARAATKRAEALLKQTIDGLAASVVISGPDGRMLLANSTWERRVGPLLPPGCDDWPESVRILVRDGHYPDAVGREQAFVDWRIGLATAEPVPQELRWRQQWVLVSDRRLPDGSVVHLAVDLTPLKHAQAKVHEQQQRITQSEERLAAVLGAVPDLWLVMDAQGRYSECSDPDHPCLLLPFEQVRGRTLEQVLPPELAAAAVDVHRRALQGGEVQRLEYALTPPDGRLRHFEARVSPMPGGEVLHLIRDVSDLHQLAEEARRSDERWKFALEGAGDGVWDWDIETNRTFFSARWKQILGFADGEIGDSPREWTQRIHPDDRGRVMEAVDRVRRGETETFETEHRLRHKDGHDVWIRDRGKIVSRAADGKPRRVVGTHSDITRQKLAEQAIREKQGAELASRSKSEFLSRMSHEMRTPLNAVIGFAQLLRLQNGVRVDYVDHILTAGQHLLVLVNDVLDLQQVEEGRLQVRLEPVALAPLIESCSTLLQPLAEARGVLQNTVPGPSAMVSADAQRLRQVLLNIGANAVKYNRPAGHVTWQVSAAAPGHWQVSIEDTGSGMTASQQARLFQPFERLGRETSTIEGSGLGLVIARRLLDEMGGRLEVTSQVGRGTCMRITLPAAESVGGDEPESVAPCLRVLYVEDNRVNALLFTEALRGHPGIELRVAEDGDEAIETARSWRPDVLVLDAHLPGPSGFEVLTMLRQLTGLADVPAFMCSADALPEDLARARAAGFRGYWTKPLDLPQIRRELESMWAATPPR
jgi:PAS domain S-box-containing protein